MEIIPAGPGGPSLEAVLQDYRQRYGLAEEMVLNMLVEALSTRQAQALVAVEGGRPLGAVVLSWHGGEGQIHLLHALSEAPAVEAALLARAEEALTSPPLRAAPGSPLPRSGGDGGEESLERISATLASIPGGSLERTFRQHGYLAIPRARLVLDLAQFAAEATLPSGYRLVSWQRKRLEEAAALVHATHQTPEDVAVYPGIASLGGARRLLEQARAGAFGSFDPALAPMVLAGPTLAGLCLAVWHSALGSQGFILDLAVDVTHRRQGLGRALVVTAARAFREAGAAVLGLAVTWSNEPARRLYESLAFRVEQYFGLFQKQLG